MQTIANQTKSNMSIFVDGLRFVHVHFVDCQLIYEGKGDTDFEDCTFEGVSWTFDGAAERTIAMLAMLYEKTGDQGKSLVEAIIQSVKNGRVVEFRAEPATAVASAPTAFGRTFGGS